MKPETMRAGLAQGEGIFWEQCGIDEHGEPIYRLLPPDQIKRNLQALAAKIEHEARKADAPRKRDKR